MKWMIPKYNYLKKPGAYFFHLSITNEKFIAALLNLPPKEIVRTELLPTHLRKKYEEDKLGILDVRVLLDKSVQIDIEIQISSFKLWQERSLFYLSKMYTEQIEMGEDYDVLKKCIHVGILDFTLFENELLDWARFINAEKKKEMDADK